MSTMDVVKQAGPATTRRRVKFQASIEDLEGRISLSTAHHGHVHAQVVHMAAHVSRAARQRGTCAHRLLGIRDRLWVECGLKQLP